MTMTSAFTTPIPNQTVPTQWLQQGCEAGTNVGQCPAPAFGARPRQGAGSSGNTYAYLTLGFTKQLVKDRFTIGLLATLPLVNLTTGPFTPARFHFEGVRVPRNGLLAFQHGHRLDHRLDAHRPAGHAPLTRQTSRDDRRPDHRIGRWV